VTSFPSFSAANNNRTMNVHPSSIANRGLGSAALMAMLVLAEPAIAQELASAGPQRATRSELGARFADLERQASVSPQKEARRRAALEAAAIRDRLAAGDFRVGDRFLLTVRQDSVRTDTITVRDSLKAAVLNLPDVSLAGVLRSELEERLQTHVARYLRNTDVRTNLLTRISVLGAVARPGFYYAAPDRSVTDLVMLAGGPAPNANLSQLEIRRSGVTILKAKNSKRPIKEGRTLEQLDVQSGDDVLIPEKRKINWQLVIQFFFIVSSLMFALINFLRWYYDRQE
jgi:protein involved in polysaccharide export with SLBB domain